MEQLAASPENQVQGFLAAGHVCTVAGCESYTDFVRDYRLPVVVTGFEPVDLLVGILECVRQLERGEARVVNCYERSVSAAGNQRAMEIVDDVYEICDRPWRGLGIVRNGGLRLRDKYSAFDASRKFRHAPATVAEPNECRSGEVLTGRIKPTECECFGIRCTPEMPLGAPMVSAEGACAAYYRYAAVRQFRS
jgi:hydrogenase expression/formation protein HypD